MQPPSATVGRQIDSPIKHEDQNYRTGTIVPRKSDLMKLDNSASVGDKKGKTISPAKSKGSKKSVGVSTKRKRGMKSILDKYGEVQNASSRKLIQTASRESVLTT